MEDLSGYESKSGYDLQPGDRFRYCGQTYTATSAASGEFNAYIQVIQHIQVAHEVESEIIRVTHEVPSEIIIPHGDWVELLPSN